MVKGGCIYIITNSRHTTLYTGVTSNLSKRIHQHRNEFYPNSFSARYNLYKLVYYEVFSRIEDAIAREKQIKAGSRKKKEELINSINPVWKDLIDEFV
ncbi:MAG: GIY-YIG nuclease family protein [Bacteroidia bacterium]|nr:GIY-YIG nuclease family protein [Bacteroidia bacterium]